MRLANAAEDARVHVFATRYLPAFDPFDAPGGAPDARRRRSVRSRTPSRAYHSGREIGDEYRYILERRYATQVPGQHAARGPACS